ncbi:TIGR01906 family membrane protein [Streptococcus sp. E29BA]|uniref:TIGR01906 family membrane protein n=1 Tax=Streptococcus sp. E29BA TaxID=3278716 RepID=UPI00359D3017
MRTRGQVFIGLLWLLALAVLLTISLAWVFYPIAIEQFELTSVVALSRQELMDNFNQLMTYLLHPLKQELFMADFPVSASGAKHFADVKHLFLLAEAVFIGLAYPAVRFFFQAMRDRELIFYRQIFLGAMLFSVLIAGLGMVVGFETFFTLFHTLLFPGDSSWLFNPTTDPVILVLPAEFFLACFILFFLIYQALVGMLLLLSYRQSASDSLENRFCFIQAD